MPIRAGIRMRNPVPVLVTMVPAVALTTKAPPMVNSATRLRSNRGRKPGRSTFGTFQTPAMACWTVWVTPCAP